MFVTFNIEQLKYRSSISKVQNFDIEGAYNIKVFYIQADSTFNIGVARIQMGILSASV
jgi:hypothetical protein